MNFNERKEIINRIIEKYKQFCFDDNNNAKIKWFSLNRYYYADFMESFMIVDLADMSVKLYKFEFDGSFDSLEPEFILNAKISNTFDGIVKIVDNRLKQYYFAKKEQLKRRVADL